MTALDRQEGGAHYRMVMQPIVFCAANRYDPCSFSTMRYLLRHRQKGGRLDLDKAIHYVELWLHLNENERIWDAISVISMQRFIDTNGITGPEVPLLLGLHKLAIGATRPRDKAAAQLAGKIERLRDEVYDAT